MHSAYPIEQVLYEEADQLHIISNSVKITFLLSLFYSAGDPVARWPFDPFIAIAGRHEGIGVGRQG